MKLIILNLISLMLFKFKNNKDYILFLSKLKKNNLD